MKNSTLLPSINMMNYKAATIAKSSLKKSATSDKSKFSHQSHEEYMKMIETTEFQKRANTQMNEIVRRFINYRRQELKLEDYDDEEIESIISAILTVEPDEYDEYSSGEDDDSVYSDEDSF